MVVGYDVIYFINFLIGVGENVFSLVGFVVSIDLDFG